VQTAVIAGTSRGDAQAKASMAELTAADATMICHKAKIPQQPEV
jgi:hypothetical protein